MWKPAGLGACLLTVVLTGMLLPAPAGAQLLLDQISQLPTRVLVGPGTVRLDGMGGFEAAVADENLELNLYDFSGNPAGFSDDRDSWTVDIRYTHDEYRDFDSLTRQDDLKLNDGTFILGYHDPGNIGVGGVVDYTDALSRDLTRETNNFRVAGLTLILNKYLLPRFSVGVSLGQSDESEDSVSPRIYDISHETTVYKAGLGGGYTLARGVTLGVKGELFNNKVDGTSRSGKHTDSFDWSRPGGRWSVQGFVDRGRLQAGVDYAKTKVEGEESVRISWSERFIFNPTDGEYAANLDTFSEERNDDLFRARGRLDVVPGRIAVSGAVVSGSGDVSVITNPNALGSLEPTQLETSRSAVVGGVSVILLGQRLLLAGEAKSGSSDISDLGEASRSELTRDELTLRVGGEYLFGESVAGRLGLIQRSEDFLLQEPDATGALVTTYDKSYNSTELGAGLGVIPGGGIWQLDLAYSVILKSDLGTDRERFSAYVKYLW